MSSSEPYKICVFGSSAKTTPSKFLDEAYLLGQTIAQRGYTCVNGGGMYGVMGAVNRGVKNQEGKIVGVIHEMWVVDLKVDSGISELIVTRGNDLNERKQGLFDNSDCFIIMPGGLGTLDELYDCLGAKSLAMKGLTGKPVVLINMDGFYDGSIQQLERAEKEGLLYNPVVAHVHTVDSAVEGLEWCVAALDAKPADSCTYMETNRLIKNVKTVSGENKNVNTGELRKTDKCANSIVPWNNWFAFGQSPSFWYGLCLGSGSILSLFYGRNIADAISSVLKSRK